MNEELVSLVKKLNEIEYACQVMLTQEYADVLDETITSNQIILINLLHERGRMLTGELAKLLNITPSAVSQMLNKMEKRKLVRRSINPENRREILVELDTAGTEYIQTSREVELSIIERFYSKLPKNDLLALKEIMEKFLQIIEQEKQKEEQK
ncbi:MarR family transcriptional regulator [Brevibacillus parabrevis]|uniref:MarR family winged helix-turn-helix transcriptional regulator n=1 Tax=Brevibacillus parabrevis TaxID=54914 RepID=UPI0007ABD5B0|nr:MarR family transcriptional regulator [Brevibacillus parabrevis]KZE48324.1 MarR family transcriptional regulator [Brevibacillus parabrevis]